MNARTRAEHLAEPERDEARGTAALRTHLRPLQRWFEAQGVTEVSVNRPGEVWIARQGEPYMERHLAADLTDEILLALAQQDATSTEQEVSREKPLLSAEVPNGFRVQFILPPASGRSVALSIRRPAVLDLALTDYERTGAFDLTNRRTREEQQSERDLRDAHAAGDFASFLAMAGRARQKIPISGGEGAGESPAFQTAP